MRLFEFDDSKLKTRVKKAIDKLDDSDPTQRQTLVHVKNTIFDGVLQKTLEESKLKDKIGTTPYDWFKNILEVAKVPLEEKINFIKLISNPSNLMSDKIFTSNSEGTVLQYISTKISSNEAFKATADQIWNYKIGGQGGMGPAELFFVMFAKDARKVSSKEGGDVAVGNWKVELKREGSVSPGSSSHRVVDSLNDTLINTARKENLIDQIMPEDTGKVPATSLNGGWLPEFFKVYAKVHGTAKSKAIFADYLNKLYGEGSSKYVDKVFNDLGTPQAERSLAPMILQMYKEIHKWDSICFVSDGFRMVNLVTFDNLPDSLTTSIKLKRGGDTQAVADGYMNVGLASSKKTPKSAPVQKTAAPKQPTPNQVPPEQPAVEQPSQQTQTLDTILQNANSPLTQALSTLPPEQQDAARKTATDLLASGQTEDQVATALSQTVAESMISRLKHLANYKNV